MATITIKGLPNDKEKVDALTDGILDMFSWKDEIFVKYDKDLNNTINIVE